MVQDAALSRRRSRVRLPYAVRNKKACQYGRPSFFTLLFSYHHLLQQVVDGGEDGALGGELMVDAGKILEVATGGKPLLEIVMVAKHLILFAEQEDGVGIHGDHFRELFLLKLGILAEVLLLEYIALLGDIVPILPYRVLQGRRGRNGGVDGHTLLLELPSAVEGEKSTQRGSDDNIHLPGHDGVGDELQGGWEILVVQRGREHLAVAILRADSLRFGASTCGVESMDIKNGFHRESGGVLMTIERYVDMIWLRQLSYFCR